MSQQKIGVLVGRFQPYHFGHNMVVRKMVRECDVCYVFVCGNKKSEQNPLPFWLRRTVINLLNQNVNVIKVETGFIPFLIRDHINVGGDKICVYSCADRVNSYEQQFLGEQSYDYEIVKIPERFLGVSSTSVRKFVIEKNFDEFEFCMPHTLGKLEKKILFFIYRFWINEKKGKEKN